jgi:hypothetical protein
MKPTVSDGGDLGVGHESRRASNRKGEFRDEGLLIIHDEQEDPIETSFNLLALGDALGTRALLNGLSAKSIVIKINVTCFSLVLVTV